MVTSDEDELDYAPLTRRAGLRTRLRAVWGDTRLTIAATVITLLLAVPVAVLVVPLVTAADLDSGVVWMMVFLLVCGLWAGADLLGQAGATSALTRFAEVNGLEALDASIPSGYAGSLFVRGSHRVQQGVRTPGRCFVEVGDRFPTTLPSSTHDTHQPELYLRARLSASARRPLADADLVTPAVHDRLAGLAGTYAVEVSGDELTLFGTRGLDPGAPGRVEEALDLARLLADRAEGLVDGTSVTAVPTMSGIPVPVAARPSPTPTRGRSPWAVIGAMLLLLVAGPLVFALVMSVLDDGLRGNEPLAAVVVVVMVGLLLLVVRFVITRLLRRPPAG